MQAKIEQLKQLALRAVHGLYRPGFKPTKCPCNHGRSAGSTCQWKQQLGSLPLVTALEVWIPILHG